MLIEHRSIFILVAIFEISNTASLSGRCEPLKISICEAFTNQTMVPNILGYNNQDYAALELPLFFPLIKMKCSPYIHQFICAMYAPNCDDAKFENGKISATPPCRSLCQNAKKKCGIILAMMGLKWPSTFDCAKLPDDTKYDTCVGSLVQKTATFTNKLIEKSSKEVPLSSPSKLNGGHKVLPRRYDIIELGYSNQFRGWVDIEGRGAAHDYCRVVGEDRKWVLTCTLASSVGWGGRYVSKQGFDPGWRDTWFMRDMDGDNRDDYCRCVGEGKKTKVTCMKAGPQGFYGSHKQPGSQFTFDIPNSRNCAYLKVNPFFGRP